MADDWSARAHTRPGYATYADTPAGDPTSPHRPPRPGRATYPDRRQAEDAIVDKLIAAADEDQLAYTSLGELRDQAAELVDRMPPTFDPLPATPDASPPPDDKVSAVIHFDGGLSPDEAEQLAALMRDGIWTRPPWWRRTLRRITRRS